MDADHKWHTEPSHEDDTIATDYGPVSKHGTCIFAEGNVLTLEKGKLMTKRICKASTVTKESRSAILTDFKSPSLVD